MAESFSVGSMQRFVRVVKETPTRTEDHYGQANFLCHKNGLINTRAIICIQGVNPGNEFYILSTKFLLEATAESVTISRFSCVVCGVLPGVENIGTRDQ
ncbi:uncharacterized protein ColSpa_06455 [Colletotrichum spaethianum]|uniref:Uncharacterized protein n=1 Tax=Colletotrichum spaethianum TaxID=700344 RepID=A0AA37LH86_9PEZI|nr:uncharacterized protein ColSpa_06455 [Colletotrichum spaethianum]GKT46274.1 hypothetical protein ColSpa_06455 [Colletotrichum spaethianum]